MRVIGNVSLWEVIPRSLATTFITLLPVAALYWFGGDTLKDFAFALLIGIGAGSYSSIFIAAPLLAVLKEREPEFARRRDDLGALEGVESVGGTLTATAAGDGSVEEELELDAEEEAVPERVVPAGAPAGSPAAKPSATSSKRERRRQRRASRPHGRAR
jgi:SecD/SecF fusion protein